MLANNRIEGVIAEVVVVGTKKRPLHSVVLPYLFDSDNLPPT
jgi:hypothetical protein